MQLRRQFQLVVLAVRLLTSGPGGARIRLTLEAPSSHKKPPHWSHDLTAAEIGLVTGENSIAPASARDVVALPSAVVDSITRWLDETEHEGPLWIHLIKPYGLLGGIGWEMLLAGCDRPLLRLPDALARPPVETPSTLNIVLCASISDDASAQIPATRDIVMLAKCLSAPIPMRDVHVWIFTDPVHRAEVEHSLSGTLALRVHVVDPNMWYAGMAEKDIPSGASSRSGTARSAHPWLEWMAWSMSGIEVDVVHFLCDGDLASEGGQLAIAGTPRCRHSPIPFVGAAELDQFLIAIGAWSVAFTAPPRNSSKLGLRMLADQFAQTRPGPVLHHDLAEDLDCHQLDRAYSFLYRPDTTEIAKMPAIALCCQPVLAAACAQRAGRLPPRLRDTSGVDINLASYVGDYLPIPETFRIPEELVFSMGYISGDVFNEEFTPGRHDGQIEPEDQNAPQLENTRTENFTGAPSTLPSWLGPGQRFVESKQYELQLNAQERGAFKFQATPELLGIESGLNDIQEVLRSLTSRGLI